MLAHFWILWVGLLSTFAFGTPRCRTNAECLRLRQPLLKPRFKGQANTQRVRRAPAACTTGTATATFSYTGGLQSCTFQPGTYTISAGGATGGSNLNTGYGTLATGTGFIIKTPTIIQLAVGGEGGTGSGAGGGGGGSFVYIQGQNTLAQVLVVGGGGGGGSFTDSGAEAGDNAPTTATPGPFYPAGSGNDNSASNGGRSGNGGGAGTLGGGGAGGGGCYTNGTSNTMDPLSGEPGAKGGIDLLSRLAGGTGSEPGPNGNSGGFGGGGGGGPNSGGGGGGYSGGGGGGYTKTPGRPTIATTGGGGGGSSYVSNRYNTVQGAPFATSESYSQYEPRSGNGIITIVAT